MALHALARNPEQEGQVKLFIPQLPKSISLAMMREHFGQFGEGVDECVLKQKQGHVSHNFGFVWAVNEATALRILMQTHVIGGEQIPALELARGRGPPRTVPKPSDRNFDPAAALPGKLFVGGLAQATTERSLRVYFEAFGEISEVLLPYDAVTHRSRGFGFVTFVDQEPLRRVMSMGQYHMLEGNRVQIKPAMSKEQMSAPALPPGPGQGQGPGPPGMPTAGAPPPGGARAWLGRAPPAQGPVHGQVHGPGGGPGGGVGQGGLPMQGGVQGGPLQGGGGAPWLRGGGGPPGAAVQHQQQAQQQAQEQAQQQAQQQMQMQQQMQQQAQQQQLQQAQQAQAQAQAQAQPSASQAADHLAALSLQGGLPSHLYGLAGANGALQPQPQSQPQPPLPMPLLPPQGAAQAANEQQASAQVNALLHQLHASNGLASQQAAPPQPVAAQEIHAAGEQMVELQKQMLHMQQLQTQLDQQAQQQAQQQRDLDEQKAQQEAQAQNLQESQQNRRRGGRDGGRGGAAVSSRQSRQPRNKPPQGGPPQGGPPQGGPPLEQQPAQPDLQGALQQMLIQQQALQRTVLSQQQQLQAQAQAQQSQQAKQHELHQQQQAQQAQLQNGHHQEKVRAEQQAAKDLQNLQGLQSIWGNP